MFLNENVKLYDHKEHMQVTCSACVLCLSSSTCPSHGDLVRKTTSYIVASSSDGQSLHGWMDDVLELKLLK